MKLFRAERNIEISRCYTQNRKLLFGVARRILREDGLAEDAMQTAWLKVGQLEEGRITDEEKLRNLLVIVVKNTAVSMLRAQHQQAALEAADALCDDAPGPAEKAESADAAVRLRLALASLSPADQDLLLLKYDNELTNAQIAMLMGLSEEAVKKRVQRTRIKLKQIWEVPQNDTEILSLSVEKHPSGH